ncbi:hypothetical protein ID853_01150 [Xenorhabdus sp. Vera]|uniref:hypothetical protein n=1 Tax=Xenorhabdus koppenhoeferi TaxID=351659 RepID=UPI0019863C18|nr:hypothetical protein [Xenorhabdus sp. Vera]MBD2809523.1 hypothetical protein [Xenorhabdus sp. Vera]
MMEYLFRDVCHVLKNKQDKYIRAFNYASCEKWLCNELCQLINDDIFMGTGSEIYCYDEVFKTDITVYKDDGNYTVPKDDRDNLLINIEVKLLYPKTQILKKKGRIIELVNKLDKLKKENNCNIKNEGWVFCIWTDYYMKNSKTLTNANVSYDEFKNKVFSELKKIGYSIELEQIIDGTINYRLDEQGMIRKKAIRVNAFRLTV